MKTCKDFNIKLCNSCSAGFRNYNLCQEYCLIQLYKEMLGNSKNYKSYIIFCLKNHTTVIEYFKISIETFYPEYLSTFKTALLLK